MAIHKGKDLGRMGGSCFFQPKKKNFFSLKTKAVQEQMGFLGKKLVFHHWRGCSNRLVKLLE